MKQSVAVNKSEELKVEGMLKTLLSKINFTLPRFDGKGLVRNLLIPVVSIILFVVLWHFGAKALFTIEADYKIQKALTEQGQVAADLMQACIQHLAFTCSSLGFVQYPDCRP